MSLEQIAEEVRACILCPLHKSRTIAVPGEGPRNAAVMLVGEAPGSEEDRQGRPFVGRAGGILDDALQQAGIKREELFITNVVKCRPPLNRTPYAQEIKICVAAYLQRQIGIIKPEIICLLGKTALSTLLGEQPLAGARGRVFRRQQVFFPTYHPAAAARNPSWHRLFVQDMKKLRILMADK